MEKQRCARVAIKNSRTNSRCSSRESPGRTYTRTHRCARGMVGFLDKSALEGAGISQAWGAYRLARNSLGRQPPSRRTKILPLVARPLRRSLFLRSQSLFVTLQSFAESLHAIAQPAFI